MIQMLPPQPTWEFQASFPLLGIKYFPGSSESLVKGSWLETRTYRLWGIVWIVLMSPFSWQCRILCLLSLAFILDWRVVCRYCVDFFHYEGCPIHGTPFSKFPKVEQKRRVSVETCIIRLPPTAAALATALTKDLLFCRMGVTALLIFFFSLELFSSSCCIRLCFSLSGKEGS